MADVSSQVQGEGESHRLAAIVAIDLAGYSARTEADEAAAVRAVRDLRRMVEAEAQAHGGRLFNSAGDGFMLEFPTASGALAAAEAIARDADPPVRVGVHLGEVTATAGGDLLGHGINIAARLQAMAKPGAVLVSDAVKRATLGPASKRLVPQGRVRLDKMNETVAVFGVDPHGGGGGLMTRAPFRRFAKGWPIVAAVALAVALSLAGFLYWRSGDDRGLEIAVAPFPAATGDPEARAVSAFLPRSIVAVMNERQARTVSLDAAATPGRGGARLMVSGVVEHSGPLLRIRITLDDRKSGRSLWSGVYERPIAEADALSEQVAVKVGDIVDQATRALGPRAGSIDSETLAAYLKISDRRRFGPRMSAAENLAVDRQIVARAPDFALGHANLAFDLAASARTEPPEIASGMRTEARAEVQRALKLDAKLGDAYSALAEVEDQGDYATREAVLRKGLLADPQNPSLNNYLGDLYRGVGRLGEAEPLYKRGLLLDPLSPAKTSSNIFGMAGSGDQAGAEALMLRGIRLFPDHVVLRRSIVYSTLLYGPPDIALTRLQLLGGMERLLGPASIDIWRAYLQDRRRGQPSPATLRRIVAGANADIIDPSTAVSALTLSGDVDAAFAVTNAAIDRHATFYSTVLFEGATRAMRQDRRFIPLLVRLGLIAYWRQSGVWPDFCAEPGLPYDCKAEMAKTAPLSG